MEDEEYAFLDEITGFLGQCEASMEGKSHSSSTGDDGLLLASHQLLTETEQLLASYKEEGDSESAPIDTKSSEEDKQIKVSAEMRREIRNAQAAERLLRYRQKLKEEKKTLKQQATELSSQLTDLQTAQEEVKAKQARSLTLGAWRAIAARQLERRVQAEQQRKLLRAEVVGQSRMIHQMNLLLQQKLQSTQQENLVSCESMDIGGSTLLKTMVDELDELYSQTDDVLQGLEFKSAAPVTYDFIKRWKEGVLYFDSADRMELPYDFELAVKRYR